MTGGESLIVRVEERVNHIENLQKRQDKDLEEICISIKDLQTNMNGFIRDIHRDIAAIRVEMAKPQGIGVTSAIIINMLSVMTTALAVYFLTSGKL